MPETAHEPATEQFASKAWTYHWTSPLFDWRRHEHGFTPDVSVVAGVSRPWFAAHTGEDSRAFLPQARRSLHCGRNPSKHLKDLRTKSRSAAQSLRNMLVRATEVPYNAALASTERCVNLAGFSDSLGCFIGLERSASSSSRWVCYRATLASTSNTATYAAAARGFPASI